MDESKKKIAIVTVCSLILVAMVVALVVVNRDAGEESEGPDVSSSKKAIAAVCETTDYKKACVDSLNASGTNATDPQELIRVVFQATLKYIQEAAQNSTTLQDLEKDPKAKSALDTCRELAARAGYDLERSFAKFNTFDITNVDDILLDLKIWLSGAITHQETCLDGFDDVAGEAGMKMKEALTTGMQMTSNALAMVQELSTFLEGMGIQSFKSRRLLDLPDWIDAGERRLLAAPPQKIKADLVVAKDGSGKYTTINAALKDVPENSDHPFVLYIKEGVYNEIVKINSSLTHLIVIGDGPTRTRITGNLNYIDGTSTYHTATVAVQGDSFIARDIGFENTAGAAKHQAVALRVSADKTVFYNCHMDGYQDTVYAHTYRQFYRNCVISGTIDFVFGDSAAVFQGCTFLVRKPLDNQQCIVTAQGRKEVRQPTALVLQNCTITAAKEYYPVARSSVKTYLGRPWKEFSRTIIMESFLDSLVEPEGWLPWNATFALDTLFYTEFNNRGPAAPKTSRVKWTGVKELPPERIQRFTAVPFLDGNKWIPVAQVPYAGGFIFPVPKEDPNIKYSPVSQEENKDLGSEAHQPPAAAAAPPPSHAVPVSDTVIVSPPASSPAPSASPSDLKSSIWELWMSTDSPAPSPIPTLSPAAAPSLSPSPAASPSPSLTPAAAPSPSGIAAPPRSAASPAPAPSVRPAASPVAASPVSAAPATAPSPY
ncbi:putative pectinesterase/pectinesterase inhibitor 28 [Andrographis paniculata]|uniref:putative pectinesterase/pectinesterase inhibitor 28 n=1 Tax=Andrographis paniculata TaxID=175694 RepID=UPI0021E77CA9|nr:putative pectinesterase/pectinesterase inhibitor 28 [Andrographis paniculata]